MQKFELLSLLVFLIIVFLVYNLEIKFIISRIRHRDVKSVLLKKPIIIIIHFLAVIGMLCFLYGYFIEPYWIQVNTVNIFTKKLKNTPLKIVQISDLHCDRKIRNENKLVDIIGYINPDIVVFTGDALNTIEALPTFKETMKKLKAKIGKFAVRGNFDVWYWHDIDLFNDTGFKLLDADSIRLEKEGEVFYISGLSTQFSEKCRKILKDIPNDSYSIFLYHYSDLIEDLKNINVDLYLAGHVHGGQVALPFYGALITLSRYGKKYERGRHIVGNKVLYVNRGIGMEGGIAPKVRFWSRPEITVFNIIPEGAKSPDCF